MSSSRPANPVLSPIGDGAVLAAPDPDRPDEAPAPTYQVPPGRLFGPLVASALLLVLIGAGVVLTDNEARSAATPTISVSPTSAATGQQVTATGGGWGPAGALVRVTLCGNNAASDDDCAADGTVEASIQADGSFSVPFTIPGPPAACPCVVRARGVDSDRQATAPLTMGNSEAPVSAGDDAASTGGHLEVTRVRVDGWDGPAQWFGAPARRKLSVTVRNTGDQTLHDPPLSAGFGKGGEHKALVTGPAIGDLGPGQTRTVAISVALKPFAVGSYHVGGSVGEGPEAATFDESVRTFPWGWLVVLAFIAFRLVQSFRRKKRGAGQDHQDDLDEMLPIDLRDAPQRSTAGDAEPVPVDAPTGPFPFVLSDDDRDIRATVSANGNGRRPFQPAAGSSAKADATPAFGDGPPFGSRRAPIPVWEPSTPAAATEPADTQQPRVDAPQPAAAAAARAVPNGTPAGSRNGSGATEPRQRGLPGDGAPVRPPTGSPPNGGPRPRSDPRPAQAGAVRPPTAGSTPPTDAPRSMPRPPNGPAGTPGGRPSAAPAGSGAAGGPRQGGRPPSPRPGAPGGAVRQPPPGSRPSAGRLPAAAPNGAAPVGDGSPGPDGTTEAGHSASRPWRRPAQPLPSPSWVPLTPSPSPQNGSGPAQPWPADGPGPSPANSPARPPAGSQGRPVGNGQGRAPTNGQTGPPNGRGRPPAGGQGRPPANGQGPVPLKGQDRPAVPGRPAVRPPAGPGRPAPAGNRTGEPRPPANGAAPRGIRAPDAPTGDEATEDKLRYRPPATGVRAAQPPSNPSNGSRQ